MDVMQSAFVVAVGVFSGMIGVTVGGSALIAIPVLMMLGVGPLAAIATNKFAMLSSAGIAGWKYHRMGMMPPWRKAVIPMITLFITSAIGALLVVNIAEQTLTLMVIGLLVLVLLLIVAMPDLGLVAQPRKSGRMQQMKSILVFSLLGLYMGFFGPGFGTFAIMGLIYVYGLTFVESAAMMNLLSISGLISSVMIFAQTQVIDYETGIPLMVGVTIGGWLGAHFAVLKGNVWLKRALILVTLILIANLVYRKL